MSASDEVTSRTAPEPVGPFPHAKRVGNLLFLSGIGPRKRGSTAIPGVTLGSSGEIVAEDIVAQCHAVFENVRTVLVPALTGAVDTWPRKEFFYWTDDGNLCALRYNRWKVVFLEQREHGFHVWEEPLVPLRFPKLFCLRTDPFERADHEAEGYGNWRLDRAFLAVPAQAYVANHLATYVDFPPRQKPGSFSLDQVLAKLQESSNK